MNLTNFLIILSGVFTVIAAIPYIIEIIRGVTKPRFASWIIWNILVDISCAAALVEHQYPTALLLFAASVETLAVVVLGWRHGDKKFEKLDAVCLTGALIGVVLWAIFNSPAIAVIATVAIDLVSGAPTLLHSWKRPGEETWQTFLLSGLGAICTLLVINSWLVTAIAYPLYLVTFNFSTTVIILTRRIYLKNVPINVVE
ncbi:MAG: hypothetical protein PHO93_01550 [Candidatus Saccharimonadaceae bacterium]|nr:hypothetical protein [Candidatus Saccharimonadaceae bacterium]